MDDSTFNQLTYWIFEQEITYFLTRSVTVSHFKINKIVQFCSIINCIIKLRIFPPFVKANLF
jgi:hypothetical protein